jgi:hypothetical protein
MRRAAPRLLVLGAAVLALALEAAQPAAAEAVSSAQVRALAQAAAAGDAAALDRLREVDTVDGRAMRLRPLLAAGGAALDDRLRALADGAVAAAPGTADPQAQASAILDQPRYRGSPVPRPLHGVIAWIGDKARWIWDKVSWPVEGIGEHVPGGARVVWTLLALALLVGVAIVVGRISLQRGGVQIERAGASRRERPEAPEALEREADAAERAGELGVALRLRFRAGLIRLARARVIPLRGSIRTGEVRRVLRSRDFDELAKAFDEVVYGGRPARPDDLVTAKTVWPRVLETVGKR